MYCVIGEKILKCEIIEKITDGCLCKVGANPKGKAIPNNRLFKTEEDAKKYMKKKTSEKIALANKITDDVNACKVLYDNFFKETGITVRVIDRRFKIKEVENQLQHLRKKFNKSAAATSGEPVTPKDSREYSTKSSSSFAIKEPEEDTRKTFGKDPRKNFTKHFERKSPTKNYSKKHTK